MGIVPAMRAGKGQRFGRQCTRVDLRQPGQRTGPAPDAGFVPWNPARPAHRGHSAHVTRPSQGVWRPSISDRPDV